MNDREREVCLWARAHMDARDFVVVDTETTGLDESAEVVSVAVVNAWGKLAFYSLVKPVRPIDEYGGAFSVNGITNAMLECAPCPYQIYNTLLGYTSIQKVIAYNSDFDSRLIRQSFDLSIPMECAMLRYSGFHGDPGYYGEYRWQRLENACAQMGIPARPYHDAASDALATYLLIAKLSGLLDIAV